MSKIKRPARLPGFTAMDLIWQPDSRRLHLARETLMAQDRGIVWLNVVTVISAAILIGAEVFGAAFAGGWALAILIGLDETGAHILQAVLFALGVLVMTAFIRAARRVEPFTKRA